MWNSLHEYRDIMACNYMEVSEARVPKHKIPLNDKDRLHKRVSGTNNKHWKI